MIDFDKIFKGREYKKLEGVNRRNLLFLIFILLLTFLALGHVLGGQKELKDRMSDPYTNWINIPKTSSIGSSIDDLVSDIEKGDLKDQYKIEDINYYQITWFKALDYQLNSSKKLRVRSIDFSDDLIAPLLSEDNIVHRSKIDSLELCDIVISESALIKLGFDYSAQDLKLPVYDLDYIDEKLVYFFPIGYVVKDLPDNVDVIISDQFMSLLNSNVTQSGFIDQSKSSVLKFFSKKKIESVELKNLFKSTKLRSLNIANRLINDKELYFYNVEVDTALNFLSRMKLVKSATKDYSLKNYTDHTCNVDFPVDISPFYYSIYFKDLSKVKQFRDYVKDNYDIIISLSQVESRDNFYLMSRLANLFIYLLVVLSGISILLYLQNVIKNHLEKIKPSIGTLKAFGLSDGKIGNLYLRIISKFYLTASIVSFVIILSYWLLVSLTKVNLYFNLFDIRLLIIWVVLFGVLVLFFSSLIRKILFKTPGDLIYNR